MRHKRHGLAMSEFLVALGVIFLLALLFVPQYGIAAVDRETEAAREIVNEVQAHVYAYKKSRGRYPTSIKAEWFPLNKQITPYRPEVKHTLIERGGFGEPRPLDPRLSGPAGYWYNPANGVFVAFVPDQGTTEDTEDLFERVNPHAR
ncbi:hypothetical protein [Mucisphaera sp.]|uniref:hypothetical protein n=1 Tax=Mucisphaera sp. TaxID=2913024 RepID=UPI003D11F0E0